MSNFVTIVLKALYLTISIVILTTLGAQAQTAPTFTSTPNESGVYGASYVYNITTDDAEGNTREITLSSGTLPPGTSLTDNGNGTAVINGTPTTAGTYNFTLRVTETDGILLFSEQTLNLVVDKAPLTATADDQAKVY
ncbi:putative Ig domain-containing protein, partial [Fulvivirga aurantia]|uniref:putative Ig domain-containing protein n=1 Tax=Fulvivirga aurantia TaxID=2529383 RepID=UPI001CA41899